MVQVLADNCASRTDNKLLAELVNDGLRVEGIGVTTAAVVRAGRQLAGVKNFVDHLQSEVTLPAGNFVPSKSKIVSADVQKALVEVMANNTAARADNQLLTVLVNASLRLQDVGPTTAAVVWAGRRLAGVKRWCGMASSDKKVTDSVVDNSKQWMQELEFIYEQQPRLYSRNQATAAALAKRLKLPITQVRAKDVDRLKRSKLFATTKERLNLGRNKRHIPRWTNEEIGWLLEILNQKAFVGISIEKILHSCQVRLLKGLKNRSLAQVQAKWTLLRQTGKVKKDDNNKYVQINKINPTAIKKDDKRGSEMTTRSKQLWNDKKLLESLIRNEAKLKNRHTEIAQSIYDEFKVRITPSQVRSGIISQRFLLAKKFWDSSGHSRNHQTV
jgi:hypothetical protein